MSGPCLCGDPYCHSCFPGRDHRVIKCGCGWAGEIWELDEDPFILQPALYVGRCPECDNYLEDPNPRHDDPSEEFCSACQQHRPCSCDDMAEDRRRSRLSRNERLELAADAGFDTWDDYNGEK